MRQGLNYLKSLLYLAGQTLSAVAVCFLALVSAPLPSLVRARIISSWARFNIWTLKLLWGINHRVTGAENIPSFPAVILSNHQSAWETLCFQLIFPPQSYLLKKELLWLPIFGWGLALNRPVAIDRSKKTRALETLVTEGTARLKEGRCLVIFPEGTRRKPGEMGKFQVGGAMIAARSGYPVVPVAHNAGLVWPKNSFLKFPGTVDVMIGPLIETRDKKAREINEIAENWIGAQQEKLLSVTKN